MNVEVKDGLAGTGANVEDGAVAIFYRAFAGDVCRGKVATAYEFGIFGSRFFQASNMFLGNDQNVSWSLRVQIFEGKGKLIFIDFL